MPGRRSGDKLSERRRKQSVFRHVRAREAAVAAREVRVERRELHAPLVNDRACALADEAVAGCQLAARLAGQLAK